MFLISFSSALYLGEADSPPLYVIHTLAKANLNPRHVVRVAERLRLAFDKFNKQPLTKGEVADVRTYAFNLTRLVTPATESEDDVVVRWPKNLIGLYRLLPNSPMVNPRWSPPVSTPHNVFLLPEQSHR